MNTTRLFSGSTAYKKINDALNTYEWYQQYRSGKIIRSEYLKTLMQNKVDLINQGLNEDQIHLSTRFSLNTEETVDSILNDLHKQGIIPNTDYPKSEFEVLSHHINREFDHGKYTTYIFPEEARLLYALTFIMKPKTMVFLGSYYGYWAIWAATILKTYAGKAYLIDIDSDVISLANTNMKKFQLDQVVTLINEDAIQFMAREQIQHDLLVVDPEGPKEGDNPDLLDKAIYYPMVKAAHPFLSNNGLILCHNILLSNPLPEDPYFKNKIEYNEAQFQKFLPFMNKYYQAGVWYDTTEGVGIFTHKKL